MRALPRLFLSLAVLLAGCPDTTTRKPAPGKAPEGVAPAASAASASRANAPSTRSTVTPAGGQLAVAGATLTLPPGAVGSPADMTMSTEAPQLASLGDFGVEAEYLDNLKDKIKPLRVYRLGPDGTKLAKPGTLTVDISADELPPGTTLADVAAVSLSGGELTDLPITVTPHGVSVEVPHYSMLALAVGVFGMVMIGGMAILMRGASDPMMRRDCAKWLNPTSPRVAELAADQKRFQIDTKTGDIHLDLGRPAKGKDVAVGNHALPADKIIENPEGDCVNFSNMYGSLLLARGYPVRLVAGTAVYKRGDKTYKGFHQWAETVIDGKAYYVDTFDPDRTKLIPVSQATSELSLGRNRMCGKNPDGSSIAPTKYDTSWFQDLLTDTDAMVARYKELQAEHKVQHELCVGGDNAACDLRKQLYQEAMEIRTKLNAKGIDPTKR